MQEKRTLNVQVKPLNISSGMKIIGEGSFQQKYSRDDNAYYPNYSAILPLMVTVVVNVVDPDGIMPNGLAQIDRIDWYLREIKAINKISPNNPDYEIAIINGVSVLKIKRNTPVGEPFLLIGQAFYTNPKTGRQESRIEQHLLSTVYYQSTLLSLMAGSPTEVIIDPTKIAASNDWQIQLKATLRSGEMSVADKNAVYWWHINEGAFTRRITTSDSWLVTPPNSDGTYPRVITVDASRFKNLKLECRAAYKGASDPIPTSPKDASLSIVYTLRVDLPAIQDVNQIPIAGSYIEPRDINTDKPIKSRCEITAGGRVVDSPEKYFNITWVATKQDGSSSIIGYGEYINTTVKALGITYSNPVILAPRVMPKLGSWNMEGSVYNGSDAAPAMQFGVNQIANKLGAYLVSCSDGENVSIIGKLKNNNYMRFEDGSLAPTIVNSSAEDKGYNIMYGWAQTVHTIENAKVGDEVVALFGEAPFEYQGVKSRPVPPTLVCPCLPTVVNGKFRSMYFRYDTGCNVGAGLLGITAYKRTDKAYPKAYINQLNTNDFAMAHNKNTAIPMPFAPLMDWHLLNITNALMNKFGTVCLHSEDKFGGGISSNYNCTAENWGKNSGVRYKVGTDTTWIYGTIGSTPSFCSDAAGAKTNWCDIISRYYPRMACMEIQIVLSHAAENNIAPGVEFTFDNERYRYENVPGAITLLQGEMNARLYKVTPLTFSAFNASGTAVNVTAEIMLQTSAVYGMDLVSCDVFEYAGAGIEKVAEILNASDGASQNPVKQYLCVDQTKLVMTTNPIINLGESFAFENNPAYERLPDGIQQSGYRINLIRGTRLGTMLGGSLLNNSAYTDISNYTGATQGKRVALGHRVRGIGTWGTASARFVYAYSSLAAAYSYSAGGFQLRLPEGALSAATSN